MQKYRSPFLDRQHVWAERVEEGLAAKQWTRQDLASALGVSKELIRNWLTSRSRVDVGYITELAASLDQDPLEHLELLGFIPLGYRLINRAELERTIQEMDAKMNSFIAEYNQLATFAKNLATLLPKEE